MTGTFELNDDHFQANHLSVHREDKKIKTKRYAEGDRVITEVKGKSVKHRILRRDSKMNQLTESPVNGMDKYHDQRRRQTLAQIREDIGNRLAGSVGDRQDRTSSSEPKIHAD